MENRIDFLISGIDLMAKQFNDQKKKLAQNVGTKNVFSHLFNYVSDFHEPLIFLIMYDIFIIICIIFLMLYFLWIYVG